MTTKYAFDMLMLAVMCLYVISINSLFKGSTEFLKLQCVSTVQWSLLSQKIKQNGIFHY